MKIVQALGFGFAFTVLSTGAGFGCSGDSTPASTGSSTGTSAGSGVSTSGTSSGTANSGSTASGTAVSGTFATSGTMPTSGTMDTSGTMAASGTMMMSGSMAGSGAADAGGGAPPTVAEVKALCTEKNSPYHTATVATMAFTPAQFCTLFEGTCAAHIIKTADLTADEATCETAYGALAMTPLLCRTEHVCNAAMGGANVATHCPHAQGWKTATVQAGGPCM